MKLQISLLSKFCISIIIYIDDTLLVGGLKRETINSLRYTNAPTRETGDLYQHLEINTKSNIEFGVSRGVAKFAGYDIEPFKRENKENTEAMLGGSEPAPSFDENITAILSTPVQYQTLQHQKIYRMH